MPNIPAKAIVTSFNFLGIHEKNGDVVVFRVSLADDSTSIWIWSAEVANLFSEKLSATIENFYPNAPLPSELQNNNPFLGFENRRPILTQERLPKLGNRRILAGAPVFVFEDDMLELSMNDASGYQEVWLIDITIIRDFSILLDSKLDELARY
jgi:hypothetical protein